MRRSQSRMRSLPVIFLMMCAGLILSSLSALGMERDVKPYRPSAFMVVQGKTVHEIVASKMRFAVTRQTEIVDLDGNPIKLQMLPVPCKAQIDYELRAYGDPVALRIKIVEVSAGATLNWTRPAPE